MKSKEKSSNLFKCITLSQNQTRIEQNVKCGAYST